MKVEYKTEAVDKSINTTKVEIIVKERTFNQMWEEADNQLKSSINRFYNNFIKNF